MGEDVEGVGQGEEGDGEVHCCWVKRSVGVGLSAKDAKWNGSWKCLL